MTIDRVIPALASVSRFGRDPPTSCPTIQQNQSKPALPLPLYIKLGTLPRAPGICPFWTTGPCGEGRREGPKNFEGYFFPSHLFD